jgi:hypothetical protein
MLVECQHEYYASIKLIVRCCCRCCCTSGCDCNSRGQSKISWMPQCLIFNREYHHYAFSSAYFSLGQLTTMMTWISSRALMGIPHWSISFCSLTLKGWCELRPITVLRQLGISQGLVFSDVSLEAVLRFLNTSNIWYDCVWPSNVKYSGSTVVPGGMVVPHTIPPW